MAQPFFRHLDTVGDGTGSIDGNGNYSVTPRKLKLTAASELDLHRMMVEIRDTGAFSAEKYGALAELTNGVKVEAIDADDNVLIDLLDGTPIKSNAEWGANCYDVDLKTWGAGDEFVLVRWTFAKAGAPLTLHAGESLQVTLQDDLSGLVEHHFLVQGVT